MTTPTINITITPIDVLKKQLRWAWAKLNCRCLFNDNDEKIHDDAHCPVHGVYTNGETGQWTDPFGNKGPYDSDIK